MTSTPSSTPDLSRHAGREVLVCVCGGIAAYKVATVVSRLAQAGAVVTVAMTDAARQFVGPVTFQALSGRHVLTSLWQSPEPTDAQHIRMTDAADLLVVAPATANMIGKIAGGLADDLVSTLVMSAGSPVLIVPAMNARMWHNPIVSANAAKLKEIGYHLLGPAEGWQACRSVGPGRMVEPEDILSEIGSLLDHAAGT